MTPKGAHAKPRAVAKAFLNAQGRTDLVPLTVGGFAYRKRPDPKQPNTVIKCRDADGRKTSVVIPSDVFYAFYEAHHLDFNIRLIDTPEWRAIAASDEAARQPRPRKRKEPTE